MDWSDPQLRLKGFESLSTLKSCWMTVFGADQAQSALVGVLQVKAIIGERRDIVSRRKDRRLDKVLNECGFSSNTIVSGLAHYFVPIDLITSRFKLASESSLPIA